MRHASAVHIVGFDRVPTQSVILPNGSTAVVSGVRGNAPGSLQMLARMWSRLTWTFTPRSSRTRRVEVTANSLDGGQWSASLPAKDQAEYEAARVRDSLFQHGNLSRL